MTPQHRRSAYAVCMAVQFLAESFTRCTFATLTFQENITSKSEAADRWRPLKERLRRKYKDLLGVGVWQRQKRGAWHLHIVLSSRVSIEWLRAAAIECGFGSFINLKAVDIRDKAVFNFHRAPILGAKEVARYITRYMNRQRDARDKGVRVVEYLGREARRATTTFRFMGGFARLWRAGCQSWFEVRGVSPSLEAWEDVIEMGWDRISTEEKTAMMEHSRAVYQWRHPEKFPF